MDSDASNCCSDGRHSPHQQQQRADVSSSGRSNLLHGSQHVGYGVTEQTV